MKRMIPVYMLALSALAGLAVLAHAAPARHFSKLQLSDVPPAVRKAIEQEAASHPLDSITMEEEGGGRLYEGTFRDGQQQIELKMAGNGLVVSREVERRHQEDQEENDD